MITATTDPITGEEKYDYSRLHTALLQTKQNLALARERRYESVATFLSPYNGGGILEQTKVKQPCRLFKMTTAVQTYQRLLAARRPKVFCRTWDQDGVAYASMLESAINLQFEVMEMQDTFKSSVLEAMFAAGIVKTGLNEGEIYCELIDFDDIVFDCAANNHAKLRFIGNYYRIPLSEAQDYLGDKNPGALSQLEISEPFDVKRLSTPLAPELLEQEVEFLDVFLPREQMFCTFLSQGRNSYEHIESVPWQGPETGPYDILAFGEQSKSCIPLAPAWKWREMSRSMDELASKLVRQAKRQKSTLIGQGEKADFERIAKSEDGSWLMVAGNAKDAAAEISTGGPSQQNFAFLMTQMEWFNEMCGNLNVLSGLGTEAGTAHQEELLNQNAGGMVDEMRDRVQNFAGRVAYKVAWYLWHSDMVIPIEVSSPSGMASITHLWTREQRQASWDQFRFSIEPYSMVPQTPTQARDQINTLIGEVIAPLAPQLMAQGYMIDAAEIVKLNAKFSNLPEINRIVKLNPAVAMQAQQQGGQQEQHKPVRTKPLEYIRTSRSAPTSKAKNAAIRAQAQGQTQQPKQQAQAAGAVA